MTVKMAKNPLKTRYYISAGRELPRCTGKTNDGTQCTRQGKYKHGRYMVCGHHNGQRAESN